MEVDKTKCFNEIESTFNVYEFFMGINNESGIYHLFNDKSCESTYCGSKVENSKLIEVFESKKKAIIKLAKYQIGFEGLKEKQICGKCVSYLYDKE